MIRDICFIKDITRIDLPLSNVKIWAQGEEFALKKWIGFGFSNHLFVSENKNVTLYCDTNENDLFYDALDERLNEDFFNDLCIAYFRLIDDAKNTDSHDKLFSILVMLWPILTIFQEISLYPTLVSKSDLSRLIRIRKNTDSLVYRLFAQLEEEEEPIHYYYFRNNLYEEEINLDLLDIKNG